MRFRCWGDRRKTSSTVLVVRLASSDTLQIRSPGTQLLSWALRNSAWKFPFCNWTADNCQERIRPPLQVSLTLNPSRDPTAHNILRPSAMFEAAAARGERSRCWRGGSARACLRCSRESHGRPESRKPKSETRTVQV